MLLVVLLIASLLWVYSGEPYYRGRPVSHWAIDYSPKLYPSGTAPLSASKRGLDALREMGPQKAATALVRALMGRDSQLYQRYRSLHPRLPSWYQSRFPLRLTHQQEVALVLGSTEFFDLDYQKAMVPFIVDYLEKPDASSQVAACELLAKMTEVASPALPALKRLTAYAEPLVGQAAQAATDHITSLKGKSE